MQHLWHERSFRALGVLHLLWAACWGAAVVGTVVGGRVHEVTVLELPLLGICALHSWVGIGLWRLDRRVRVVAALLHAIGLLAFPAGTFVSGYILLFLLFGPKADRIFSKEYRELIARTPGVRHPGSMVAAVLLPLLVVLLVVPPIVDLILPSPHR